MFVIADAEMNVQVFSLLNGERLATVGAKASGSGGVGEPEGLRFRGRLKMCFSPRGTLLVSESEGRRIQEITVMGEFQRFIGQGTLPCATLGVHTSYSFY